MGISFDQTNRQTFVRLELTPPERIRLASETGYIHFPVGRKADHTPFIQHAVRSFLQKAPPRIVEAISRWHADPDRPGVLIVDGWGTDPELPPTPTDGRRSPGKLTTYSEQVLVSAVTMLGQPISFADERQGDLVADLTPVRGKEAALTNEGAGKLGWHTEHAATGLLLSPPQRLVDYLAFFHLREDPLGEAKTLVADIRDALPLLGPDTIETLRRPAFVFRPPFQVRASLPAERQSIWNVPVLGGQLDQPYVNAALYGDLTEGMNDAAQTSLAQLRDALDAVQRQVPTTAGRMVLVDIDQ